MKASPMAPASSDTPKYQRPIELIVQALDGSGNVVAECRLRHPHHDSAVAHFALAVAAAQPEPPRRPPRAAYLKKPDTPGDLPPAAA